MRLKGKEPHIPDSEANKMRLSPAATRAVTHHQKLYVRKILQQLRSIKNSFQSLREAHVPRKQHHELVRGPMLPAECIVFRLGCNKVNIDEVWNHRDLLVRHPF